MSEHGLTFRVKSYDRTGLVDGQPGIPVVSDVGCLITVDLSKLMLKVERMFRLDQNKGTCAHGAITIKLMDETEIRREKPAANPFTDKCDD